MVSKKLFIFLSIFLLCTSSAYARNGSDLESSGVVSIRDASTETYPWEITFTPDGGVSDDGDDTATIDLVAALGSTFLKLDASNDPITENLTISGDIDLTGTGPDISFAVTGGDTMGIHAETDLIYIKNETDSKIYFLADSNHNVTLAPDGKVGIGLGLGSPSSTLDVGGTGRITGNLTIGGYTLPTAAGTDNQILKYNGTVIGWEADAGGAEVNNLEVVCTGIATTEIPIGTAADTVVYAALSSEATMDNAGAVTLADSVTVATWSLQGATLTGDINAGGADFELPQGQTPDTDGDIDLDFTDGSVVIQHGSAHAELASATDVVVGKLIKSWSATIFEPDNVNDIMTLKAINSEEFPHGVVITAGYLGISENTSYTLVIENWDDFDTQNGDGTIISIAYTADTTGEILDDSPTFDTIPAGQIIMMNIPSTDVDWIHIELYYYEPIA